MTIEPGPASAPSDNGKNMALVLYILSLAGFFTGGLTSLVALIIGLVKRMSTAAPSTPATSSS